MNNGINSGYRKWVRIVVSATLVLYLAMTVPFSLASEISLEHKIKAAFTYNFIKFVDWSEREGSKTGSEFVISIIGDGPINPALIELEKKKVFGKVLKIRRVENLKDAGYSDVYFINDSAREELEIIFKNARKHGILTIGDMDEFCEKGGIINFVILEDSIQFEINQKEALLSKLPISYKLLNQASRVIR